MDSSGTTTFPLLPNTSNSRMPRRFGDEMAILPGRGESHQRRPVDEFPLTVSPV
jgi:hypothetical protein